MFIKIDDDLALGLAHNADADEIYSLIDSNRHHLRSYLDWVDKTDSVEDTKESQKRHAKKMKQHKIPACSIYYEGKICGMVDLQEMDPNIKKISLGYWLAKNYSGLGIITRATIKMIDYAFDTLKANYIVIKVAKSNHKSRAVAERLNFHLDGTLPDDAKVNGSYVDRCYYGMHSNEWLNKRPNI